MIAPHEPEFCPACGERIRRLNPHRMDAAKVKLLQQIAKIQELGLPWVKVQRDGKLIKPGDVAVIQTDDVHALRLTWFGLLERKERRSGLYRITEAGKLFLIGRHRVPDQILCKNGRVVKQSSVLVPISHIRNVVFDKAYWDGYAARQVPEAKPFTHQPFLFS